MHTKREPLLTSREASERTRVPARTLVAAAKADPPRLRAYWMGPRGPVLFDPADLDAFIERADNTKPERHAPAGN